MNATVISASIECVVFVQGCCDPVGAARSRHTSKGSKDNRMRQVDDGGGMQARL